MIVSIECIFPLTVEGTLTYTRTSGKPISQLTVYIPISEAGENIFKVFKLKAASAKGVWTATPGPSGADEYPDYWTLSGPPLEPGESLEVQFEMDYTRGVNYEAYPWRIVADIETVAPVTVYEHHLVTIVVTLQEYRQMLTLILGSLAAALTVAAIASTISEKPPPTAFTYPPEARPVYEEAEECAEWKYVCLRFFVVDECGGKRKGKKEGLLKGVRYGRGAFGELSEEAAEKIQKLIEGASKIWEQCCIRLIPCRDSEGKPFFKAFDPKEAPYKEEARNPAVKLGKHWIFLFAKATYTVDLCQFLNNRKLITRNKGKSIRPSIKQRTKFVWTMKEADLKLFDKTPLKEFKDMFKAGRSVEDTFKEILRKIKDGSERASIKKALQELRKALPEKEEKTIDVIDLFSRAVDKSLSPKCINVFVFGDYEDTTAGEEAGVATMPGRVIFLDEAVVTKERYSTLAHEVGHTLGLDHKEDEENVMHAVCGGSKLTREQCEKANTHLEGEAKKDKESKLCDKKAIELFLKEKMRNLKEKVEKAKKYCGWIERLRKRYKSQRSRERRIASLEKKAKKHEKKANEYEAEAKKWERKADECEKKSLKRTAKTYKAKAERKRKSAEKERDEAKKYRIEIEALKNLDEALKRAQEALKKAENDLKKIEGELKN